MRQTGTKRFWRASDWGVESKRGIASALSAGLVRMLHAPGTQGDIRKNNAGRGKLLHVIRVFLWRGIYASLSASIPRSRIRAAARLARVPTSGFDI